MSDPRRIKFVPPAVVLVPRERNGENLWGVPWPALVALATAGEYGLCLLTGDEVPRAPIAGAVLYRESRDFEGGPGRARVYLDGGPA